MLDLGLQLLINNGLASPPFQGGFMATLPQNFSLPNWTYLAVTGSVPNTGLLFVKGLNLRRQQIDVYGTQTGQGGDAIAMATQIDGILNGFAGNLPDPDSTFVSSCIRSDTEYIFDPEFRTYRVKLEYEIHFASLT